VPVRQTRGIAACAARRVSSSPSLAAIARAKMAGSFLAAWPPSDTSTMRATTRAPFAAMQLTIAFAFETVSVRSVA
jgi:hypothetical protein